jgi:hypothetical protein
MAMVSLLVGFVFAATCSTARPTRRRPGLDDDLVRRPSRLRLAVGVLMFVAIGSSARPLSAQPGSTTGRGAEFGGYVGTARADGGFDTVLDARRSRGMSSQIDDSGVSTGFVATVNLNEWVGVEMLVAFTTNRYHVELRDLGTVRSTLETPGLFFLLGNGVIHLAPGRVVPFVSAGAGLGGPGDLPDPAFNFGAGLKVFLSPRVALRIEARQFLQPVSDELVQTELVGRELIGFPQPYTDRLRLSTLNVGITFFRRRR